MEKVLIHVKWNDSKMPLKDQYYRNIKKDLDKVEGVEESFVTEGSKISNVAAIASWHQTEIADKIRQVKNIKNVKSVEYRILVPA